MISGMTRWGALLAGLALLLSACGSDRKQAKTPPPARTAAPESEGMPAAAADVAVIRGWADALRGGHVERAVRYFAIPSVVSNGTRPIRLSSRADVRFFNRTLPCGAKVVRVEDTGRFVVARFRLTERPGAGSCGSGVGNEASPAFLIRHGRIAQWRRVLEPSAKPSGTQS